jgi:hypothetical protein
VRSSGSGPLFSPARQVEIALSDHKRVHNADEIMAEMWAVGKLISETKPLPADFDVSLDVAEVRALDALPELKALIGEVCGQLAETSRGLVERRAARGGPRADKQGGT